MNVNVCERCLYVDGCDGSKDGCEWFLDIYADVVDESDYIPSREEFSRRFMRIPPDGDDPADIRR